MTNKPLDPSLVDTAADPKVFMMRSFAARPCAAVLGKYGEALGYQFCDNNGDARCAFTKPCPKHDHDKS